MVEKKFSTGDTVQLKSGGPLMTVDGYAPLSDLSDSDARSETDVECAWFENGKMMRDTFHQDMLNLVDKPINR